MGHETVTETFDCGDSDLNAFLQDDALRYFDERMAVTYMLLYGEHIVAYYCLLNDKVTFDTAAENERSLWNRFNRKNKIPNLKRRQNYPAVKLGRFAVSIHFKGQGAGRFLQNNSLRALGSPRRQKPGISRNTWKKKTEQKTKKTEPSPKIPKPPSKSRNSTVKHLS
jgi:hypothetical protein